MDWSEVERRQPRLAEVGRRRLIDPGLVLVATMRRDGTPRLSPVEPWIMDGVLWLSMMWGSTKATDLARDPRILVHNVVTNKDGQEGEFKIRGTAQNEVSLDIQRRYAAEVSQALGWNPEPGRFHLFGVGIEHIAYLRYDPPTGDQYGVMWPPAREFIRRATSETSVGSAEPLTGILLPP
jgi:hypothetical protein